MSQVAIVLPDINWSHLVPGDDFQVSLNTTSGGTIGAQ